MEIKPLYKATRLVVGNSDSNTGIVTLWTKSQELAKTIDKKNYALMGNLYSAERGLDLLIRNLLANPQITNLIVTGTDFSKSGIVLMDFFNKGFEHGKKDITEQECWRVKSEYEGYIETDIPEHVLQELRNSIHVLHVSDIKKFDFSVLPKAHSNRKKQIFMKKETDTIKYQGEEIGYIIRGKTVAECWLQVIDTILKFGVESGTHYDDQQKEIVNLMSIITDEDPNNLYIPEYFPSDKKHVQEYIPRITRDLKGALKNEYTYGSRMRSWFGIDQVNNAIEKLAREPISRAVVISLWDSVKDMTIGGSPCLNHIWFRIRDNKLNMTCVFRSHDMFEGYPENALGLRVLQEEIRNELNKRLKEKEIKLGSLIILSQSAHIYDDSWERCSQIISKYHTEKKINPMGILDPRGNIIITVENNEIRAEHTSTTNETLGIYTAKSAEEMRDLLRRENIISLPSHALYLGIELHKAETALLFGKDYIQDQPLKLK
jgi:thymidylate synthase